MAQISSYRDLEVWMLSMDLVDDVFRAGRAMPRIEFDLRRQMIKAAISIPSNIAEGWKRKGKRASRPPQASAPAHRVTSLICFASS